MELVGLVMKIMGVMINMKQWGKEFCKNMSEIADKYNKIEEDRNRQIERLRADDAIPDILERIEDTANKGGYTLTYKPRTNIDLVYLIQLLRENYGLGIWDANKGIDGTFNIDWKK